MNKFILKMVSLLSIIFLPAVSLAESSKLAGIYRNEAKDALVEITQSGEMLEGRIYAVLKEREFKIDIENSDEKLKERRILGLKNLTGFKIIDETHAEDGKAYDPKNGKTYSAKMWLEDDNTLKIRGFIGISLLGRTATMDRVTDVNSEAEKLGLVLVTQTTEAAGAGVGSESAKQTH